MNNLVKRGGALLGGLVFVAGLTACGNSGTTTGTSSTNKAVMPSVVCMNLQDAQDKIQKGGVFFSRSRDGTGRGRSQIIDSNWVVIAQNPQPGSLIGEGDAILTAVKYGETSAC